MDSQSNESRQSKKQLQKKRVTSVVKSDGWQSLFKIEDIKTRKQFDGVDDSRGLLSRKNSSADFVLASLLEYLCMIQENDKKVSQSKFQDIASFLIDKNLLNPSSTLDEFQGLRANVSKILFNLLFFKKMHIPIKTLPQNIQINERYNLEFKDAGHIGKGGFGSVRKAINKLDGRHYAIKKIWLKNKENTYEIKRLLDEVKTLASLKHKNIVGYNSAWLEYDIFMTGSSTEGPEMECSSYSGFTPNAGPFNMMHRRQHNTFQSSEAQCSRRTMETQEERQNRLQSQKQRNAMKTPKQQEIKLQFETTRQTRLRVQVISEQKQQSLESQTNRQSRLRKHKTPEQKRQSLESQADRKARLRGQVLTEQLQSNAARNALSGEQKTSKQRQVRLHKLNIKELDSFSNSSDISESSDNQLCNSPGSSLICQSCKTLYIQMELCDQTLEDWLNCRNSDDKPLIDRIDIGTNLKILTETVEGLEFIHSKGIIHRDIKPANIFLKDDNSVKIGDFGLAKRSYSSGPDVSEEIFVSHSVGVGTSTYSAPEQLNSSNYNTKSDIYSLGLIVYELYYSFTTVSERLNLFHTLKETSEVDDFVIQNFPDQAELIKKMMKKDPAERLAAQDILSLYLCPSKDDIIKDQQKVIECLKNQVKELKLQLQYYEEKIPPEK